MFTTIVWIVGICAVVGWLDAAFRQSAEFADLSRRWAEPVKAPPQPVQAKPANKKRKVMRPAPAKTDPLEATFEWEGIT